MKTGTWVMTRGIAAKIKEDRKFAEFVYESIGKYVRQDWGDTCEEDSKLNDSAVKNSDSRIVAKYDNIFIITEWDRSVTTVLFTEEY